MPKKAKELSALAVAKLKTEGRHAVGGADGLHLRIAGGFNGGFRLLQGFDGARCNDARRFMPLNFVAGLDDSEGAHEGGQRTPRTAVR